MNRFASIAFALALSAGSVNLVKADQPAQQVIDKILNSGSGYTQVTKLEAEDGRRAGSVNLLKADRRQRGPDWLPALYVIDKVLNSGYTHVTNLEAEDGQWEGEGIKNGQKMEFYADPKTGVITSEAEVPVNLVMADQQGPDWLPAVHVIDKVLNSGYTHVTKLEAEDGRWEGEGIKNGQKMEFHADPKTGVITSEAEELDD